MASSSAPQRSGTGRKKVKIAKMENKSNLQVTFSKRRNGLFKKASELCTLTGSEVGILVYSPGNKVFSFGHPSVSRVMDACFPDGERDEIFMRYEESLMDAYRSFDMVELNMELTRVDLQLAAEKERAAAIGEREKMELQWKPPIESMMRPQLNEMGAYLRALKDDVMRMTNVVGGMTDPGLNPVLNPSPSMNLIDRLAPIPDMGNLALNSLDVPNPDQNIYDPDMNNPIMNPMGGPDPDMGDLGVHEGGSGFKY